MMSRQRTARIIPVALALIAVAIIIAALVSFARVVFFSGSTTTQIDTSKDALLSTSVDRAVRMTVRGPIVADEDFRSYQIQVTPNGRILSISKGYLNQPVNDISLDNNIPAYEQFVYALDKANLMTGAELTGEQNDLRGVCAAGRVYEFQILKADKVVKKLWTSTCAGSRGSLTAKINIVTNLFTTQIPEFKNATNKLWQ